MRSLKDKVVVVTGAGSGIGRALAREASARGARVAICDVDEAGLATTAAQSSALSRRVDVRSEAEIAAFADQVARELGDADVLVNNAGVSLSATFRTMPTEEFERLMDINFWGVVRGTRAFLPQLERRPEASLVNISSVFGLIGVPSQSAYCASKFAVRGFTESLAIELRGTAVKVSVVCPGGVKTNIAKNGRHLTNARGEATSVEETAANFEAAARTSSEDAASQIWRGVLTGRARILVGIDASVIEWLTRVAPVAYAGIVSRAAERVSRPS